MTLPLARRDVKIARLPLACAVMSLMWVWLNVSSRGGFFGESYAEQGRVALYACRLLSLVLVAALSRFLWSRPRTLLAVSGSLVCVGALVHAVALATQSMAGDSLSWWMDVIGEALCGLGYLPCLFAVLLGLVRTSCRMRDVSVAVLIAMMCKEQVPPLLSLLPVTTHVWVLLFLLVALVVTLACYGRILGVDNQAVAADVPGDGCATRHATRQMLLLGCVAYLTTYVFGMASGIGLAGSSMSTATHGVILAPAGKIIALAVLVLLSWGAIVHTADMPRAWRFVPAFVILALSTTLSPLILAVGANPIAADAVAACLQGVYDFSQVLVWVLVASALRLGNPIELAVVAGMNAFYHVPAVVIGSRLPSLPEGLAASLIVSYGLLVIIIAVLLPAMEALRAGRGHGECGSSGGDQGETSGSDLLRRALACRCRVVADRFGLTKRETEVFTLLCQGLSREAVCEELGVSIGTVKAHIAHIYEKTGINTREGLSALVFEDGRDDEVGAEGEDRRSLPPIRI
ncbi:helix-turn-helix transcriptional regulator [bacterium]|nr:helix-turn-helix transcriptional regulator [bacterium]